MSLRLLLPLFVGVALRMALVAAYPGMDLHGDEKDFTAGAEQILETGDTEFFPFRPPLYLWFIAGVFELSDHSQDAVKYAQCLLEGLSILGVFLLVRRTLGERAAPWAAWVYALFPDYIVFSHYLWSETLTVTLLVWGLLALVRFRERPSLGWALVVGLVWGLSDLIKPYHFYMLPILLGWLVWSLEAGRRKPALVGSLLAVVVAGVVITPWSLAMSAKEGAPVLICTTGAKNLLTGVNNIPPPQTDYASEWFTTKALRNDPANQRDVGVVAFILDDPWLFAQRAVIKWSYLWSPNSFFVRNIYKGDVGGKRPKYGRPERMQPLLRVGSVYLVMGATAFAILCLLVGVFAAKDPVIKGLAVTYCGTYCAMITLTPALSRYRLPLMLFAVIYAGAFLARVVRVSDLQGSVPRMYGATLLVGGMVLLWVLRLPNVLANVW